VFVGRGEHYLRVIHRHTLTILALNIASVGAFGGKSASHWHSTLYAVELSLIHTLTRGSEDIRLSHEPDRPLGKTNRGATWGGPDLVI
jgi:hypothetical protein